jgi:hypothetical protein
MRFRAGRVSILACIMFLFWSGSIYSIPTSSINIKRLGDESDLVIVGKVGSFAGGVQIPEKIGDETLFADLRQAHVEILQILKGQESDAVIPVEVPVLQPSGGSVLLDGIPENSVRLLFLKSNGPHQYQVSDARHPSLPATEGAIPASSLLEMVASVECNVIINDQAPLNERHEAIWSLDGVDAACIIPSLRTLSSLQLPDLRLPAEQALILHGDIAILPDAISNALAKGSSEPQYLKDNILHAISVGVRDPVAIEMLDPLLKSERSDARWAAARALKNIGTPACLPALRALLTDDNQDVRYVGVIGLADIKGIPHMHPSITEFQAHEDKYISYWKSAE